MLGKRWLERMRRPPAKTLAEVLDAEPQLNYEGFGAFGAPLLSAAEAAAALIRGREKLLAAEAEVEMSLKWLKQIKKADAINPRHSSCGLKHCVERVHGGYVANGSFIAAAIIAGFQYELIDDGPNVRLNVDEDSVNRHSGV